MPVIIRLYLPSVSLLIPLFDLGNLSLFGVQTFWSEIVKYCSINLVDFQKMAVPPSYSDLGKSARDLFNKGFSKYIIKN